MPTKQDFAGILLEFFAKWWLWFAYIAIGIAGKFGMYLVKQNKMTFWQIVGSAFVACFVGFLTSFYCYIHCPKEGAVIVPIATLVSDKIIMFMWAVNWVPILEVVLGKKTKK